MNNNKPLPHIEQRGGSAMKPNVENLTLNLGISELLALQDNYTTLQCECRRFTDWVLNLSRNSAAVAIRFDNECLNLAADTLIKKFQPKTDSHKE